MTINHISELSLSCTKDYKMKAKMSYKFKMKFRTLLLKHWYLSSKIWPIIIEPHNHPIKSKECVSNF